MTDTNNFLGVLDAVLKVHSNLGAEFSRGKFHTLSVDSLGDTETQLLSFIFQVLVLHILVHKKIIKRVDVSIINQLDKFLITFREKKWIR